MKLICNSSNPPLGGLLTAFHVKSFQPVDVHWANETTIETEIGRIACESSNDLSRSLARLAKDLVLYGSTCLEQTEVDHWLSYCIGPLCSKTEFSEALSHLNQVLGTVTYLVAKRLTIADFSVFAILHSNQQFQSLISDNAVPANILRWYNLVLTLPAVNQALKMLPDDAKQALVLKSRVSRRSIGSNPNTSKNSGDAKSTAGKEDGKFVDLPGAEMGKVVVRFPPEASGYLHIGHAKAALLNQYYQEAFKGKLIMRFDDTNPAKETIEFENVILDDVKLLEIKPDLFTHTSDYFDLMLQYCEQILKEGSAYVDDTEPETMKLEREQRQESSNRNNSVEKNFSMWEEMKKGTEIGQRCCVRAKIDMTSPNGCMRDPTIYRCKNEPHPRTGTKYKVYPTYDFACPIVDAIEGVTHTLRTMEYHDRDDQFYWFIEALKLRRPYIWEYSRLSMTNTVLSKRKLTWFVQEKLVDGWDDPRMPTVRGVIRRGMTVKGLKQFIIAQGSSRSVVFMEWDKIWAFNKKIIDPIAPRYTALEFQNPIPVFVSDAKLESVTVPKHPKDATIGNKTIWVGPKVLIDYADAESLNEGQNATFINWGNIKIEQVLREQGKIISVKAKTNLEDKDYRKTLKLTWLCDTEQAPFTPCHCVYFEHIISKALLSKDEDFKQYIGHNTRTEVQMIGDPELKTLKAGDIIQLQRRGFFKVDVPYSPLSPFSCKEQPVVLFSIPDGHTKDSSSAQKQASAEVKHTESSSNKKPATELNNLVQNQADAVRKLKTDKASKSDIDAAVKKLLELKLEYKTSTGCDWKAGVIIDSVTVNKPDRDLNAEIKAQGDTVRDLKSKKADKATVTAEVQKLLALKTEYKNSTGNDWTPTTVAVTPTNVSVSKITATDLLTKISTQGEKIRNLKAAKSDKTVIEPEVKTLLALKGEYKTLTGIEWTPNVQPTSTVSSKQVSSSTTAADLLADITLQGDKVRKCKAEKADKTAIDIEVKKLLALKAEYKKNTGTDWSPNITPNIKVENVTMPAQNEAGILQNIASQGEKVRTLKTQKSDKAIVDAEVKILLALKAEFKQVTGKDWKPGMVPVEVKLEKDESKVDKSATDALTAKINEQGNAVRTLKSGKAPKTDIDTAVQTLLALKTEYKTLTGTDFPTPVRQGNPPKESKPVKNEKAKKPEKKIEIVPKDDSNVKKQTRLGLEAKKSENLSEWYSQVITKGELIEYYDVSGCYIYRPWCFAIWEVIRDWFDAEIKKLGVQNCYFPIFVSKSVLEKEKTHIADFAPEVAWVTRSGDSELAEPIAVRPTSETVMYPAYAKWIQSYRDLPLKLNQWNNVVRWEFKHPQPFLRTREFLWQEGHTAFATKEEADAEVLTILDLYARIYTELLAIPVIKGRKTTKEKFAGGDYTTTVEAFVSASGRAIQGGTSHHLGQNFSKMFDIVFEDPETQEKKYVFQNSWGITTRTIGVMIMVHSDDQGLVLPPKVASIQIVIVPCGVTVSLAASERQHLTDACTLLEQELQTAGVRVKGDYRENYSPGWKFNHWELKGVPIRVELGPKDLKNNQLVAVRRDTGEKITMQRADAVHNLPALLNTIQANLLETATKDLESHHVLLTDWAEFCTSLDNKNIILTPFCGEIECEDNIKADSTRDDTENAEPGAPAMGAKSLCIPFVQPRALTSSDKCIHPRCNKTPKAFTLFGRSY